MKITFKQFSKAMDLPEITEDSLNEIFGFFKNNDKIAAAKKKREDLTKKLGAQQYALQLKQKNQKMASANKAANTPSPARKDPRSASGAKAAEMDWIKSMQSEGVSESVINEMKDEEIFKRCTTKLGMSKEDAKWVVKYLDQFFTPDFSEASWADLDADFRATLAFKKEYGPKFKKDEERKAKKK